MPRYEMPIIIRCMKEPQQYMEMLKRTATRIFNQGGIIRNIENLGTNKSLPYRIRAHTVWHDKGSYFLFDFHGAPTIVKRLHSELRLDEDVIRHSIISNDDHLDVYLKKERKRCSRSKWRI